MTQDVLPTRLPVQGDPRKLPKIPQGCNSGDSLHQLAHCRFPLGGYWSNWAQQHRTSTEGLLAPVGVQLHISSPPCHRLP